MKYMKLLSIGILMMMAGCSAQYTTPGGPVNLSEIADKDIREIMSIEPQAQFPASIATAQIQASGYSSHSSNSFGTGRYSVVTTREAESDESFERLSKLPQVRGIAPLNKMLLSTELDSIKSLREAAARLKADMLLIYTFDTSFHVGAQSYAPVNIITLGFLDNKDVSVTTTVSAALFDVRTEYLYGLSEATAKETTRSSVWSSTDDVDDLRKLTEKEAFDKLIPQLEATWSGIVREYAK